MTCCSSEKEVNPLEVVVETIQAVGRCIAPMWPLSDFVAVNPLFGSVHERFLEVRQKIRRVRNAELLMPTDYFCEARHRGEFNFDDFKFAYMQVQDEQREITGQFPNVEELWHKLFGTDQSEHDERLFHTIAELIDGPAHLDWQDLILQEISKVCGSHYDEGQAIWLSPWRDGSLYTGWKESVRYSTRMERLGLPGFRELVGKLPDAPSVAIAEMLKRLEVPSQYWYEFLLCEIYSVNGWASFIQGKRRNTAVDDGVDNDLVGLLAIRLAYDVALAESFADQLPVELWPADTISEKSELNSEIVVPKSVLARLVAQKAIENSYRKHLASQLLCQSEASGSTATSKQVQMVFCIDVRSEIIRRNLESVDANIETFGFAGFFGLAMEYFPLGAESGSCQCPVLIQPSFAIRENVSGEDKQLRDSILIKHRLGSACNKLWKIFQTSAISCFSFVETAGFFYFAKLLQSYFRKWDHREGRRYNYLSKNQRAKLSPDLAVKGECGLSLQNQIEIANSVLKNIGITDNFGRIIALVGHGSETVNNPYQASLDCGACGGHSGKSNARVLAKILNSPEVRQGLASRGIKIPATTWFAPALHNTTTDEIEFLDIESAPIGLAEELESLRKKSKQAARLSRIERAKRMNIKDEKQLVSRARDWSETRPEWGLAGNAAFIVAPRVRTIGRKFDGRVFMHSYDSRQDPESQILELIMTAPMVVAHWINMQYYASTVDNQTFGSGNKVIHNVIGLFGIQQGNGGDLKTGLPWQSIHDGAALQHQPLRLSVFIEAPREKITSIVNKHAIVSDLSCNGWLTLIALEDEKAFVFTATKQWEPMVK